MQLPEIIELKERVSLHGTQKELDFLHSAHNYFLRNHTLSSGQIAWAESIATKYSDEKLQFAREWDEQWSDWHRDIATKVANYYDTTTYFANYVSRIKSDPENFKLSSVEWNKFCENKYAKKIRKEYDDWPLFTVGQPVKIRLTNKVRSINDRALGRISDQTGFVLKINAKPITRAAKGSKIYQVLLAGDSSPIFCHESDLKKSRGVKL